MIATLFIYAGLVFLLFGALAGVAEFWDWRERTELRKNVRLNMRRTGLL